MLIKFRKPEKFRTLRYIRCIVIQSRSIMKFFVDIDPRNKTQKLNFALRSSSSSSVIFELFYFIINSRLQIKLNYRSKKSLIWSTFFWLSSSHISSLNQQSVSKHDANHFLFKHSPSFLLQNLNNNCASWCKRRYDKNRYHWSKVWLPLPRSLCSL